jgi:hypothetical protein
MQLASWFRPGIGLWEADFPPLEEMTCHNRSTECKLRTR